MSTPLKGGNSQPPKGAALAPSFKAVMDAIQAGNEDASRKMLQSCNDLYYGNGTSPLTDAEFDACVSAYTGRFGLPFKTAPAVAAKGRTDRQAGVAHDWPLLSGWLGKAASLDEVSDWLGRCSDDRHVGNMLGSPKWDGMSIVVTYDRYGAVQRALTRGDDGLGVDVTRLLAGESHFGGTDFEVERFGVKYEVVMSWSAVERMSEDLGKVYKNPRNTVAGIVASDESASRRQYITLVPLDIEWDGCEDGRLARIEFMQRLFCGEFDEEGNRTSPPVFTGNGEQETPFYWYQIDSWDGGDEAAGVQEVYDEIHSWRENDDFDFMIDGVVFEFHDQYDIDRLGGRTNDCPAYAIAAKFPSMTGRTKVVSIDFDTGGTGRRTPVVNYEPITMDGRTFSRTSISNMIRFDALNLCVGTPIIVEIRGDILGWIDRDGPDPEGATPIPCPDGLEFTYNKQGQRVFAYSEAPLDGRCERMMVKMGIKGIKIETLSKLVNAGLITCLADCFRLDENRVASVPGLGLSSAEILCSALEKKLQGGLWDWEILASVGILNVGRTLSKETLKVAMLSEFLSATTEGQDGSALFSSLHAAIGPERCRMVMDGLARHRADILDLMSLGPVKDTKAVQAAVGDGPKYKVVVTGDLTHWDRDAFKDYIETLGHKMVGSISGKTDFLITNTPNSGTVKNRKAQELGVRIITETEAIEILGLTAPSGREVVAPGSGTETSAGFRQVSLEDL